MNKSIHRALSLAFVCLPLIISACASPYASSGAGWPVAEPTYPALAFPAAPTTLCRDATQLRLHPVIEGTTPLEIPATWQLIAADDATPLSGGQWIPGQSDLFVAFPKGSPMAPGDYTLTLTAGETTLGSHSFTILDTEAQITGLELYLTPDGPAVEALEAKTPVFYLHYTYSAACPGTPLWVTVAREELPLCSQHLSLSEDHGEGVAACYQQEGTPWERGEYTALLTITGSDPVTFPIRIGPEPQSPTCEPLFVAAGVTPDGSPTALQTRFQWYTQALYSGTQCRGLSPDLGWEISWQRSGSKVRHYRGTWQGDAEGTLWDSLTVTETTRFLTTGAYSVTLTVDGQKPLTTTFAIIPYTPPTETPQSEE